MSLRLSLSLPDADALFVALAVLRPAMRSLGPTVLAEIDGPRVTIKADLPMLAGASEPEPVEELVRRVLEETEPEATAEPAFAEAVAELVEAATEDKGGAQPAPSNDDQEGNPLAENGFPISEAGDQEQDEITAADEVAPEPGALTALGTAWTAADDARLLALKAEGRTHSEIATRLGRSVKAVDVRVGKLRQKGGVATHKPGPVVDQDRLAEIQRMRAEGLTCPQIGERVGMSGTAVKLRLMRAAREANASARAESQEAVETVEPEPAAKPAENIPRNIPEPFQAPDPAESVTSPQPAETPAPMAPRAESLPALRPERSTPAPRRVALVTEAIRSVRADDRPVLADLGPVEKVPPTRATTALDLRRRIEAHLDILGHEGRWTPRRDLDLSERAVALGGSALIPDEVERFKALCAPIRETKTSRGPDGRGKYTTGNNTEGQELLLRILRERAAVTEVAAE